jgi:hypothetical protein
MTEEGSFLRNTARRWSENKSIKPGVYNCLMKVADRIDAEMVEWPLGADGRPIKPGQTVYKAVNGDDGEYVIHSLRYSVPGWVVLIKRVGADASCIVRPDVLTHERPDSWERIAQELEEWSEDNRVNGDGEVFSRAAEFSERIRRLAEKEGKR